MIVLLRLLFRREYELRVENNIVILEPKDCTHCDDDRTPVGTVITAFEYKLCEKCNGTGKRGSGRCRNCNSKDGYFSHLSPRRPGLVPDYTKIASIGTCTTCGGHPENAMMENLTDPMPVDILQAIPIEVMRSNRPQTFNEAHLGLGTIYSITDYGAHKNQTDDELITKVRDDMSGFATQQACKYTRRSDMRLCDKIAILTSDNGWSAWPVWNDS